MTVSGSPVAPFATSVGEMIGDGPMVYYTGPQWRAKSALECIAHASAARIAGNRRMAAGLLKSAATHRRELGKHLHRGEAL